MNPASFAWAHVKPASFAWAHVKPASFAYCLHDANGDAHGHVARCQYNIGLAATCSRPSRSSTRRSAIDVSACCASTLARSMSARASVLFATAPGSFTTCGSPVVT